MIPPELFSQLIEVCYRGDLAEYFGNPYNVAGTQFEGGFWQGELKREAKMECVGGSDDHVCQSSLTLDFASEDNIYAYPGITGVLAEENTLESISSADAKIKKITVVKKCRDYVIV